MSIRNVAVIYDDKTRPETTGFYCRRALSELVEVRHIHPDQLPAHPLPGIDLYIRVDDGLEYQLPPALHPQAWWAIDTHLGFERCLAVAKEGDYAFAAQRDGAEQLRCAGVTSALWLPLGCDPEIHGKHEVAKTTDICFVGNIFPGARGDLVRLLQQHFPNMFVGRCYFKDMAATYSASRMVFNRSILNDINMRVFEGVATGSLLVTNDLRDNGQEELFRDGVHYATYAGAEELLDKVRFYLQHEESREKIAEAGRQEAVSNHTYRHRMAELLQSVEKRLKTAATAPAKLPPSPKQTEVIRPGISDGSYYEFDRPELLALIPTGATRVLEVGCAAGRFGRSLKARQHAEVIGVESDIVAAERAREHLDQVFCGDIEKMELPFAPASFDAAVCGDVLEHLRYPERLLARIAGWLKPGGSVVASIPNARHYSVVGSLLAGNWTYEGAGLLDHTHLRFFTRRSIHTMFAEAGFAIDRVQVIPGDGYAEWDRQGRPDRVQVGRIQLQGMPPEEIEEFYVYQYVITATPINARGAAETPIPAASIMSQSPPPTDAQSDPMRFTQDFVLDFERFNLSGPPFAFVRFGDGERAICEGRPIDVPRDGWAFTGGQTEFVTDLNASLQYDEPDYYLGISDSCCDQASHDWYLHNVRAPLDRLTFANIFVNGNYKRFRRWDLSRMVVVGSGQTDFRIPENIFAGFDIDALVERLLSVERPILVAAGPASPIIIHKYWQRAAHKQTIIDVGSAIDEWTKGYKTRPYQYPGTRTANLMCRW